MLNRPVDVLLTTEGVEAPPYTMEFDSRAAGLAFERVFLAYYPRIVTILYRVVGDRTRAEELTNEVFWRAHRQWSSRAVQGNPGGWLYRTATNLGIDDLRVTARRKRYEGIAGRDIRDEGAPLTPLDGLLKKEKRTQVQALLYSMKKWQAQILILRSSGLSYEELASALDMKRSSVGTMLARAEREFHKRYFRTHGAEE
jgi:RNA polymerase sigma-70 factor (ECF subfamily)